MEEKLHEIMQKNEIKLNKEKEELQRVIEEENSKYKKEIENGKLVKSKEVIECEKDLAKIKNELNNMVKEKEIIARKQQMQKEISEEKRKIDKLNKDRKQCQEAIKEEQKFSSFSEGKYGKTSELQEYKNDLEKINNELNAKKIGIATREKELRILNAYVDKMMTKYNVKAQIEKEEQKTIKLDAKDKKDVDTTIRPQSKEKKELPPEIESKQEKKEYLNGEDRIIANKIKNVQNEMKEYNRNYKGIDLEVEPNIQKINLSNVKKSKDNNTFDIENAINNVYNQMQADNRNVRDIHFIENNVQRKPTPEKEETKINPVIPQPIKIKNDNNIKYIEILEKDGNILYIDGNKQEYIMSKEQVLEEKKIKFKRLGITKMCKEIAGGRFKGNILKRKINPEIVAVLQNTPEQLKEYIISIKENRELPFELIHDLTNLNVIEKFKLNKFVKAEKRSGARVLGVTFDKNKTLKAVKENTMKIKGYKDKVKSNFKAKSKDKMKSLKDKAKNEVNKVKEVSKEKYQTVKSKGRDFIQKIPNKDSRIEAKAREAMAQKENEREIDNNTKEI